MKKLTEKEYQKIVDCFDRLNNNLVRNMQDELFNGFDFINDWPEIVSIANPRTREWAHEQYVEKEKKYYWISKNHLPNGKFRVLVKSSESYPIEIFYPSTKPCTPFTESEVREACFNPDMFDREEVE